MDYFVLVMIGLVMGVFGGLLGIGGSAVMIPAMIIFFKGNQHLYQSSAMICNFFVAVSAAAAETGKGYETLTNVGLEKTNSIGLNMPALIGTSGKVCIIKV